MFQPETEDMLPRMAPKPSAAMPMGDTGPIVRPQVPEVSILFGAGQQGASLQGQLQTNAQHKQPATSYAAWKKQVLPKVTFPAVLDAKEQYRNQDAICGHNNNGGQDYNIPRSNLYPLRAAAMPALMAGNSNANAYGVNSNANAYGVNSAPMMSLANGNQAGYLGNVGTTNTNPSSYRRSLDSCNNNGYQPQPPSCRMSVPMTPPSAQTNGGTRDVLTICAGTQTEALGSPTVGQQNIQMSNLASKQDVDDIRQIVHDIRQDQLRLMQLLDAYVFSQQAARVGAECRDAQVQVDNDEKATPPVITNGCQPNLGQQAQPLMPTNKFIQHLKPTGNVMQTPKGKPMAQSTTYRPNTPQPNRLPDYQEVAYTTTPQTPGNYVQMTVALPKPNTDKSLVMNELALKYLPNEKFTELLKELNIACPLPALPPAPAQKQLVEPSAANIAPSTPLRNVENFERSSTDISNASYKYLKKYNLLPEDQDENAENCNPTAAYNTNPAQQYETQRNSPVQHRQQSPNVFAQKPNSPYQQQMGGRLPQSSLARASTPPPQQQLRELDLDNIRRQPKFL